jgi:drug/metabolite transporter (DMT)-like permease
VVIKIGLSESPPFYSAGFRFALAAVVLGAMVALARRRFPRGRRLWFWMSVSGVLMYFGSYATVYYVEQYIDSALAAILFASFPFFVAILAHLYLPGEQLNRMKMLGLTIGFLGVVVVFGGGVTMPDTEHWWAPALMLLSPIFSAIASVIVKKHLTQEDPVSVNFIQMTLGMAVLLPAAMLTEEIATFHWNMTSISALVFLALLGSVFTFVTLYYLLRTMEATKLALIAFVTPIVASLLGWLILDERLTMMTIAGGVFVLIGIYLVNIVGARSVRSESPAS